MPGSRQPCSAAGTRVLVFARAPGMDAGKTRLSAAIGMDMTRCIHEECLADALTTALSSRADRVELWITPAGMTDRVRRWLDRRAELKSARLLLLDQKEDDLGGRMSAALESGPPGSSAVLIGSDAPGLSPAWIDAAFECLEQRDLIFGPAVDGGFYLAGMCDRILSRSPALAGILFSGIHWSASDTLTQCLRRTATLRLSFELLPFWCDLDRVEDIPLMLRYLQARSGEQVQIINRLKSLMRGD